MRQVTRVYNIYKYDELSDEAKEKVKQEYLDAQEPQFFSEEVIETLADEYGITTLEAMYSLGYCQGDGLCLHGHIDFDDLKNKAEMKKVAFKGFNISDWKALKEIEDNDTSEITFKHHGHYCYSNSVDIDIEISYYNTDKMYQMKERTVNKLLTNIKNWYFEQCSRFEQWGYDYFYEISEEDLKETCDCNNWEFYEDGRMF